MTQPAVMLTLGLLVGIGVDRVAADLPSVSSQAEAELYREDEEQWTTSVFRRITTLPPNAWTAEWLPNFAAQDGPLDAELEPRAWFQRIYGRGAVDCWINQGWVRLQLPDDFSLQGGRTVLLWGPGMFWNPSDPFVSQNNKLNSAIELPGEDFFRAHWQWTRWLALSEISEVGRGHQAEGESRRDALKVDCIGDATSGTLLASCEPGGSVSWSGWGQWTVSDALLVYGEAAWADRPPVALPLQASGPTGWTVATEARHGRSGSALGGAAYTFLNGWTLTAELWRNANGLSSQQADQLNAGISALGTESVGLANAQLGKLIETALAPDRRNYLGGQLMNSGEAKFNWIVRYTADLDDGSGQAAIVMKRTWGARWQTWAELVWNDGSHVSEYGRFMRNESLVGVTCYLW